MVGYFVHIAVFGLMRLAVREDVENTGVLKQEIPGPRLDVVGMLEASGATAGASGTRDRHSANDHPTNALGVPRNPPSGAADIARKLFLVHPVSGNNPPS